jgi:hypothetical protein
MGGHNGLFYKWIITDDFAFFCYAYDVEWLFFGQFGAVHFWIQTSVSCGWHSFSHFWRLSSEIAEAIVVGIRFFLV